MFTATVPPRSCSTQSTHRSHPVSSSAQRLKALSVISIHPLPVPPQTCTSASNSASKSMYSKTSYFSLSSQKRDPRRGGAELQDSLGPIQSVCYSQVGPGKSLRRAAAATKPNRLIWSDRSDAAAGVVLKAGKPQARAILPSHLTPILFPVGVSSHPENAGAFQQQEFARRRDSTNGRRHR